MVAPARVAALRTCIADAVIPARAVIWEDWLSRAFLLTLDASRGHYAALGW